MFKAGGATIYANIAIAPGSIGGAVDSVAVSTVNDLTQLGVTAANKVLLNAGDVLRVFTLQRNRNGDGIIFGNRPFDLTLEVVWFRELPS